MATQIVLRRDTTANWTVSNPVLEHGEPAYDSDTDLLRIGDGVSKFLDLPSTSGTAEEIAAAKLAAERASSLAIAAAVSVAPGAANGTATLDASGRIPESQVPSRLSAEAIKVKANRVAGTELLTDYGTLSATDRANNTAMFIAARDAAGVGGVIVVPKGYIRLNPVTTLDHQTLVGPTQQLGAGGSPAATLDFGGVTGAQFGIDGAVNCTFNNLLIKGAGYAVGTTTGVKTTSGSPRFNNVGFYNWTFGTHLKDAYYAVYENCEWSYTQFGNKLENCYNVNVYAPRFNCASADLATFGTAFEGAARALNIFGGSIENYGASGAITVGSGQSLNLFGVYFESSHATVQSWGINALSKTKVSIHMEGCFIYLLEHNRFVALGGSTLSSLSGSGNKFICAATSTVIPVAYSLGATPTADVTLEGDDWSEMAVGSYIDNVGSFNAGGVSGFSVRYPATVATHGTRQYVGRHLVVDASHTIRSGSGLTAARPAADSVLKGSQWYDETLEKPIWSNGTIWQDAMKNAV